MVSNLVEYPLLQQDQKNRRSSSLLKQQSKILVQSFKSKRVMQIFGVFEVRLSGHPYQFQFICVFEAEAPSFCSRLLKIIANN